MTPDQQVVVLVFDVPGRYVVGLGSAKPDDKGYVTLLSAAHVTLIDGSWVFRAVAMLKTFTADVRAYAGVGEADAECEEKYRTWLTYMTCPPDFEQEDTHK